MSAEPKQTIGDQLRAFAQKRRNAAGAPFEPHPVTRKVLQDEVARTFSARTIASKTVPPSWLAAFWFRSAFAVGLVALFVLAAVFWLPKDSEPKRELTQNADRIVPSQPPASTPAASAAGKGLGGGGAGQPDLLALNQRQNEAEVEQRPGRIPQTAPESNSLFRKPDGARTVENQRADAESSPKPALPQDDSRVASAPVPSATGLALALKSKPSSTAAQAPLEAFPSSVDKVSKLEDSPTSTTLTARDEVDAEQVRKAKEVALASALTSRLEEESSSAAEVAVTNVFYFSQTAARPNYRRNFNSPPVPPVLQSFQVQQSGLNVRVIDADGSVYEGVVAQPGAVPAVRFGEVASSAEKTVANSYSERGARPAERKLQQPRMQPATVGIAKSMGNVTFRVVGTNRSINKPVVISGELKLETNQTAEARNRGVSNGNSASQAVTLRAKASIGRNVEIPIEASGTTR